MAEERKCKTCGKVLVLKKGKNGEFYACPGFPDCKYTEPLDGAKPFNKFKPTNMQFELFKVMMSGKAGVIKVSESKALWDEICKNFPKGSFDDK